jgi:ubiquinone/menaquinone biosynthesis C-methylase UbiE
MAVLDSTQRFSSRVVDYVRFRPTYPPQVIQLLQEECGLAPASVVADIASGTGIFTRLLLENGNRVYGVEPNAEMRRAGEEFLTKYRRFNSVAGKAEATTLPDHSIDIATSAQAAHWFDLVGARKEFVRILKPAGWAVLLWNERRTDSTPFLREYEQLLLTFGSDYKEVRHERTTETIHQFFDPTPFKLRTFEMFQQCGYEALEGRLLSSSYVPQAGSPNHSPMIAELHRIFEANQIDGLVTLEYNTLVYYAHLA